jgi:hypothetical protein
MVPLDWPDLIWGATQTRRAEALESMVAKALRIAQSVTLVTDARPSVGGE